MTNPSRLLHEQLQHDRLAERAILVVCHLPGSRFDPRDPLGELRSLAETAGATVVGEMIQNRRTPDAGTYLGSGKVEELRRLREELGATLIIFDNDLSPSQIRNIEKIVGCKIIDRSELILDIFAGRATTAAAKLQVELAQLEYTYPRLRAMWSHLGQVTGGAPIGIGTRGPGETQIETDRRLVQRRKTILRRRLVEVQQRQRREIAQRRSEHYTVCVVGYTNAGKSTLFNALTGPHGGGGAYADDRLFATLTTRTRRWPLSGGDEVLLADTVGFVRDLPHHLVASFRATLEEAVHADLLLIVVDVSDPQAQMQYEVVCETLTGLVHDGVGGREEGIEASRHQGIESENPKQHASRPKPNTEPRLTIPHILVLSKIDRLADESELALWHQRAPEAIAVSSVTGLGLDELRTAVHEHYAGPPVEARLTIPYRDAKTLSWLESRAEILDREYDAEHVMLRARLARRHMDSLREQGVVVSDS